MIEKESIKFLRHHGFMVNLEIHRDLTLSETKMKLALEEVIRSRALYLSMMFQQATSVQREQYEASGPYNESGGPAQGTAEPPQSS